MPFHIKQSKDKQFYVVLTARNGEVLSTSEMLKTHESTIKNIKSQAVATLSIIVTVKDETAEKSKSKFQLTRFNSGKFLLVYLPLKNADKNLKKTV